MKKTTILLIVLSMAIVSYATKAGAETVPHYLNYQSLLYDDGGNLISDGPAGITFRITDSAGSTLFEEYQTLEVVNGAVSAIVGNGLDRNDAPVGGVPTSVLDPASSRFLEVTVDNFPPQGLYEIVSVPYSYYASEAASVANGGVNGAAIASGALTLDHFSASLLGDIATELAGSSTLATSTDLTNMQTEFRSTTGASAIGVTAGFVYSGANNVQDVLLDLDRAVQRRQAAVDATVVSVGTLQTEIDTIESDLSTHSSATTGVHGVSGSVVGTNNTQTLTNKTLSSPTITGGTMNGTTVDGKSVGTILDDHEARILEIERGDEDVPIKAWGLLDCRVLADPVVLSGNVSAVALGSQVCRVTLPRAMSNTNYAIIYSATRKDVSPTGGHSEYIENKTTTSFDIALVGYSTAPPISILVIGD